MTCRFAWAYQQLVDIRYEWAVRADQRVNQPAGSPVSDALFYLDENVPTNASTGLPGSLQYYLTILEQNAVGSTYKKTLGSASQIRPPNYDSRPVSGRSRCSGDYTRAALQAIAELLFDTSTYHDVQQVPVVHSGRRKQREKLAEYQWQAW